MKYVVLFTVFTVFGNIVDASIPNLSVKKVDRKIIERKRQDTLDMCRMFTEDEEKSKYHSKNNVDLATGDTKSGRIKRGVQLKSDKDIKEKDKKKTYKNDNKKSGRRFNFAPAELVGSVKDERDQVEVRYRYNNSEPELINDVKARFENAIIPYFIDSKTYDADLSDMIVKAFDSFEKATCVRMQKLREKPVDIQSLQNVSWLYITNPTGIRQCVHSNEKKKQTGVQMVVLGYDCMSLGDIAHEIMHVLGFSHEHTRTDRDNFVTINWDNIKPGYKKYFEIGAGEYQTVVESLPYDYASVLHYPPRAFSRNGQVTIMTTGNAKIGQRDGLSATDIEKISLVYSNECVNRNQDYLLKTCPSVVKADPNPSTVTQKEIEEYFEKRLWPYGIVNFKLRDKMEFSAEERDNIRAVINHIEQETCIKFQLVSEGGGDDNDNSDSDKTEHLEVNSKTTTTTKATTADNQANVDPGRDTNSKESVVNGPEKSIAENEILQGNTSNDTVPESRRSKRAIFQSWSRRHATNVLVLIRSRNPGCTCPEPGRPNGDQDLNISGDCFNSVNDLLHLFVHVLGLDHQHNMHDRDQYLHIVWDKLSPDIKKEMEDVLPPAASAGFPYDYQSVMHYPWLQIKNGVTNIMYPIWNDGWAMGHWQGLSSMDVQKLNLLYYQQCTKRRTAEIAKLSGRGNVVGIH